MAIPDFQSVMRPLLTHLSDGRPRSNQETLDALADEFRLTPQERSKLLPSGRQSVFTNRVAWAKSHVKRAGLVASPERGVYRITDEGRQLLETQNGRIDLRVLRTFPEYVAWRSRRTQAEPDEESDSDEMTPEEHIEHGYREIRRQLSADILERVRAAPPEFFERLVVELLVAMGYGGSRVDAGRAVGRGGDGGIDGIIKEDRLGLDTIYLQAKRWDGVVGRPEVQKFAGALQGHRARKGVFITTSSFSRDAESFAASIDIKIVLIDGDELAALMIDHGVGVTTAEVYPVRQIDSDYFVTGE